MKNMKNKKTITFEEYVIENEKEQLKVKKVKKIDCFVINEHLGHANFVISDRENSKKYYPENENSKLDYWTIIKLKVKNIYDVEIKGDTETVGNIMPIKDVYLQMMFKVKYKNSKNETISSIWKSLINYYQQGHGILIEGFYDEEEHTIRVNTVADAGEID